MRDQSVPSQLQRAMLGENRKEHINLVEKMTAVSAGQTAGTCEPGTNSCHSQTRYDIPFLDTMLCNGVFASSLLVE